MPARNVPKNAMTHSTELGSINATASPFDNPKLTWETNTLGTVNILEILKKINFAMNAVIITSDKVYRNVETSIGYKETDQLGDFDPYSSSKASADLAVQSYFKSFLKNKKNLRIGVARAGNVIGGGDWAIGRLIPEQQQEFYGKSIEVLLIVALLFWVVSIILSQISRSIENRLNASQ